MTVLIAKVNEPIIKKIYKKAVFKEATKNTSTFEISHTSFMLLKVKIGIAGYNPYALMTW